jgi:hypothetical protein
MKMVMHKNFRAFIVLFALLIAACAPKIAINIDQTSLIPKENAAQYLQSYDWVPPSLVVDVKGRCGPFTETTFSGYPYEQLTLLFSSVPFEVWFRTDDGEVICGGGIIMQNFLSEPYLERTERLTQAFVSLGGKYKNPSN